MDISSIAKPEVPQEDKEKAYLNYAQENNIEPFSGYKMYFQINVFSYVQTLKRERCFEPGQVGRLLFEYLH